MATKKKPIGPVKPKPKPKPKPKKKKKPTPKPKSGTVVGRALEILAGKISRKVVIVAMAMLLIYLIVALPTATTSFQLIGIMVVTGLALFGAVSQWVLDWKDKKEVVEE